jgi:O-antigen ligase
VENTGETGNAFRWLWLPDRRGSGPIVGSLLIAFVVTFTVTGSLALGIALAYTSVIGLLHAFAYSKRERKPALVLAHSQTQVSGD